LFASRFLLARLASTAGRRHPTDPRGQLQRRINQLSIVLDITAVGHRLPASPYLPPASSSRRRWLRSPPVNPASVLVDESDRVNLRWREFRDFSCAASRRFSLALWHVRAGGGISPASVVYVADRPSIRLEATFGVMPVVEIVLSWFSGLQAWCWTWLGSLGLGGGHYGQHTGLGSRPHPPGDLALFSKRGVERLTRGRYTGYQDGES